ncbi:two-component system sensor histidine kinase YesM [Neobacillus niacini]|uniref:sensor histidine kinase n=1 Tax=Neobacillus niacini TaxID=86668 RepID=UPI002782647A|nr:histidine kinase [Neobacillus niacini]MDQ0999974.1 two-component system sensor histidine kinase YesM [Neobacillus niacini]
MFSRLHKWNTLRNQILVVFLVVMLIVLAIVSLITFNRVSTLLKNNAEKQIHQTAVEANGRLESLYKQISTSSKLVMTNDAIQRTLIKAYQGQTISFAERQQLDGIVTTIQANTDGIFSFELYTDTMDRLIPLDDTNLLTRIDSNWIQQADYANGSLVWIGDDPRNSDNILALRRVNLLNRGFENGGYLLISIYRDYLQFVDPDTSTIENQYSILLDQYSEPILTNYYEPLEPIISPTLTLDNQEYMVTRQTSDETRWTLIILTPIKALTEGITVLRSGIIIAGIIGFIIFLISTLGLSTFITRPIVKLTKTMQLASAGSLTLNPSVTAVNEINELNSTYNQLVKETNHLIKMVYQKEITRSRSELKALQAQINPHFLFNTLDALKWSLEDKDEDELAELVVAMSNLFRYTITKQTDGDWVPIKAEIKHIEDYMEIMKMRFGDHLNWNLNMPCETGNVRIPKLLIQPLVENAVLHGAGNTMKPCTISVSIQPTEDQEYLEIVVEDDGPGMKQEKLESIKQAIESGGVISKNGNGIAISNVHKRLELYYQKSGLTIKSKENYGTKVSFVIPVKGEENHVEYKDDFDRG